MTLLSPANIITAAIQDLSLEYVKNPIVTDVKINNIIIGQIGAPPVTPISYFQRCGSAFWWPQTCEYRERIRQEVTAARNQYNARYQATRAELVKGIINSLMTKEPAAVIELFSIGEKILQNGIQAQTRKIESLAKFESVAWSIFSIGTTAISAGTSNKILISATSFGTNVLKDLAAGLNVDLASLHRFSEEPPGLTDKTLSTKGLQWDNARTAITYIEIGKELETMYKAIAPIVNPPITESKNMIGYTAILGLIVAVLFRKKN